MRRAISNMNARMLEWKCFMITLLNESDEYPREASNPELRRNPAPPRFEVTNARSRSGHSSSARIGTTASALRSA